MTTQKQNLFKGPVTDLKEGDLIHYRGYLWIVGMRLKPFDIHTIRVSVTPAKTERVPDLKHGEYTSITFGKDVDY